MKPISRIGTHHRALRSALAILAVLAVAAYGAASETEILTLDDFRGINRWSQSSWADADVDPNGMVRYVPRIEDGVGPDGEPALVATLHFKPGGYSQGVVLQSNPGDWSEWDALEVELKLVQDIPDLTVRAKPIVFPEDRWTESGDRYAATLKPGEWVTLRIPLGESMPDDLWSPATPAAQLARNRAWAVKLFALNIPETSEPVQVIIARPRLVRTADSSEAASSPAGTDASGISVSSLFRVSPGATGERIEVAGLAPAASPASGRLSLTLTLKAGLFGSSASLRLESRPGNWFPASMNAAQAEDALGTYHFVEIWSANTLSTRSVYEATLSFASESGIVSVAFGPQGAAPLVEGDLRLNILEKFDHFIPAGGLGEVLGDSGESGDGSGVGSGADSGGRAQGPVIFEDLIVREESMLRRRPIGVPANVSMRIASTTDERPFTWLAQREVRTAGAGDQLRVVFRGLESAPPFELQLYVEGGAGDDEGRTVLWRGHPPAGGEVILPQGALPPGRHTVRLAMVDGGFENELAEAEIEVVQATLSAAAHVVGYSPKDGRMTVEVQFSADQPVSELPVGLRVGGARNAVWTGTLSLSEAEPATIEFEIDPERVDRFALAISEITSVKLPPEILIEWSQRGLAGYLEAALDRAGAALEATRNDPRPVTRSELAAAVAGWLGLEAQETARISADVTAVGVLRAPLADTAVGGDAGLGEGGALQALLQTGILPAALLDGDRYRGSQAASWGDVAAVLVRASEFASGALFKEPERARPRAPVDYFVHLVELGCAASSADVDQPVARSELIEIAACALRETGIGELLKAGSSGAWYVFPGTETYRPDQPYSAVGTFGLWSRGEDVRSKGWLGNEHLRGLLSFAWRPAGAGYDLVWYRYDPAGGDLLLGRVELGGTPASQSYSVLGPTTAKWEITADVSGRQVRSEVYLSRAIPAVLAVTDSERVRWLVDDWAVSVERVSYVERTDAGELRMWGPDSGVPGSAEPASREPASREPVSRESMSEYAASDELAAEPDAGEVRTAELADGETFTLPGESLGAPWILLHQRIEGTGEWVPVLVRLEQRPEQVTVGRGFLDLRFSGRAGSVAVMPLYGIRRPEGFAADDGLDARTAALAEFWSRALAAFPVGLDEQHAVDEEAGVVWVTDSFTHRVTADAWGTDPLFIAPVPPVVALAEATGYPVAWGIAVERSETATFLGPFAFQRGAAASYALPLYDAIDQLYVPVRAKGEPELDALQAEALRYVDVQWFQWPSVTLDSTLLAAHARMYTLVEGEEARAWYKGRIAQSLAEYYDERNLTTVVQPANGQSYVYNDRIWAAGEDFDREYYVGRQLVITGEVAQRVGWDVVEPYWDAVRGLYAYYRIHWDWAWQGSTTFQTGFSFQADGVALAWEGIINMARMARLAGDAALLTDALYRSAALGASIYALWELTGWAMENDYAIMPGTSGEPPRRRPAEAILTGFLPDTYSEYTGIVTTIPSEWGASNWVHDELMARTRFFNDFRFADLYEWQLRTVPRLYPVLADRYNINSHLQTRSILYGRDPSLEAAIAALGHEALEGPAGTRKVLLRSLTPQVWVGAATARVERNEWDAGRRRLYTEIAAVRDGRVVYDWAWRSADRIDPEAPAPDPGPPPASVVVNGTAVEPESIAGGWRRLEIPVKAGDRVEIEVMY